MPINQILEEISPRKLYETVLAVESVRDPIFNMDQLNNTADSFLFKFEELGLGVSEQKFKVQGYDGEFRNLEANYTGGDGDPIIISSHYDTVPTSPGANDNGSAMALQLELARLLTKFNCDVNVKFVSFSLEELNPSIWSTINSMGKDLDLYDNKNRIKSWHYKQIRSKYGQFVETKLGEGMDRPHAYRQAYDKFQGQMTENERKMYQTINDIYPIQENYDFVGHIGLMGSSHWVQENEAQNTPIKAVLNFDEIGMVFHTPYSHIFPEGVPISDLPQYKVKVKERVGDFITNFVDKNSEALLFPFMEEAKNTNVPFLGFPIGMDYYDIRKHLPQALYADHAPFWRANIPCLMITDWGEIRSPYAHTMADTADRLDYDFIRKIIGATFNFVLKIQ